MSSKRRGIGRGPKRKRKKGVGKAESNREVEPSLERSRIRRVKNRGTLKKEKRRRRKEEKYQGRQTLTDQGSRIKNRNGTEKRKEGKKTTADPEPREKNTGGKKDGKELLSWQRAWGWNW